MQIPYIKNCFISYHNLFEGAKRHDYPKSKNAYPNLLPLKTDVAQFSAKNQTINPSRVIGFKGVDDNAKTPELDTNSEAARFFGVDSFEHVREQLMNHLDLVEFKSKEQNIHKIFPNRGGAFVVDDEPSINNISAKVTSSFDTLIGKPARMSFYSTFFGKNGRNGAHTLGILLHPETNTLYILDSLSNDIKEVQAYQTIIKDRIFACAKNRGIRIIFSNKHQQNLTNYTCNNWALANIEALQRALREGKIIDSTEKLNEVLPNDINAILKEQYEYVLRKRAA